MNNNQNLVTVLLLLVCQHWEKPYCKFWMPTIQLFCNSIRSSAGLDAIIAYTYGVIQKVRHSLNGIFGAPLLACNTLSFFFSPTTSRVIHEKATMYDMNCNGIRTHNHLVCKWTLKYLAKLAKWLSCVVSTYLYGAFDCMLSCHVRGSEWIYRYSACFEQRFPWHSGKLQSVDLPWT